MRLILITSLLLLTACQQNLFTKQKYTNFHRAHFRGFENSENRKLHKPAVGENEIEAEEQTTIENSAGLHDVEDSLIVKDAAPQESNEESIAFTPARKSVHHSEEKEQIVSKAPSVDTAIVARDAKVFRNTGLVCAFTGYAGITASVATVAVFSELLGNGMILLGIAGISLLFIILGMAFLWTSIAKMRSIGKKSHRGIKFLALFSTIFLGVVISMGLLVLAIALLFAF